MFVGSARQAARRRGPHGRDRVVLPRADRPRPHHYDGRRRGPRLRRRLRPPPSSSRRSSTRTQGRLNFVKVVSGTLTPDIELVERAHRQEGARAHVLKHDGQGGQGRRRRTCRRHRGAAQARRHRHQRHAVRQGRHPVRADAAAGAAVRGRDRGEEQGRRGQARQGLNRIVEEEPTLQLVRDPETHQTVLYSLGDTADRRRAWPGSRAASTSTRDLVDLRIPYRETIRKVAQAQGRHKKQTGGSGPVRRRVAPPRAQPGARATSSSTRSWAARIPRQFIPAVDKGVQETMTQGVLAGYPSST